MSANYEDRHWTSEDGLKLYYRDYAGNEARPPIICLHGLTRNSRDFAPLADHLAGDWRVIVPEMRGRGQSEYAKDAATYSPRTYLADVALLLADLGIDRFVAIGTSMGGLMTMLMAARNPAQIAAAVLNDIGPELDPAGIERISGYVGHGRSFPTWMHAARTLQDQHGDWFPDYTIETWLEMAKRNMALGQNGRIALDYDMALAEPFRSANEAEQPDLWPAFDALQDVPLLVVRGGLSDLLSEATVAKMQARHPGMQQVTVPRVGHAPMLDESEAIAAIDALLSQVA